MASSPSVLFRELFHNRSFGNEWHRLFCGAGCPSCHPINSEWNFKSSYQTHTTVLWPCFRGHPGKLVPEESSFWTFMVQGKITHRPSGWAPTPSGLISDPPPSSNHLYAGCPSCCNPPTLSWLGTGTKYAGLHTPWHVFKSSYQLTTNVLVHLYEM